MTPLEVIVQPSVARETNRPGVNTLGNMSFNTIKRSSADEQNIFGIQRNESADRDACARLVVVRSQPILQAISEAPVGHLRHSHRG